ncbi:MAG: alpha/beta fold hydrolase [Burkholderiales bacterium]|nr:alpha/beta fold hydrolase [Burkholderiales bacterium]
MIDALKLVAVAFLVLVLASWLLQERMIFLRQPAGAPPHAPGVRMEKVTLSAPDGTRLAGWLARQSEERAPLVVYFGGNAEEASGMASAAPRMRGWSVLAVNYRGYGESGGSPGERALYSDALAIHDYAAARADVDPRRIVAMGRSLGSGVATWLAANRALAGVVLITPYDSLVEVGARAYPFLPVRWLLRHRFDSRSRAPSVRAPALMIAAGTDTIVPPELGMRLRDAWGGPVSWVLLPQAGHIDVDGDPRYWASIAAFLAGLASASGDPGAAQSSPGSR